MTEITETAPVGSDTVSMVFASLTTLLIVTGLGVAFRSPRRGLIGQHRYANRYSDAAGARADDATRAP